jgi:protein-S-isoprenylcysteine O-methyltransferase Ste14
MTDTTMAYVALGLLTLYSLLAFGLRTWLQLRRTGDSGFRGISGRPGTAEWWAGVMFIVALVAGVAGPVTALVGHDPIRALVAPWIQTTGIVAAMAGIFATVLIQLSMGTNWRIGVDEAERTELVTSGPFALARNPIFTAMAITGAGLALIVPNFVALTGVVLLLVALQLQARVVEEPYLLRAHGATYAAYGARTGRFVPWIGRIRSPEEAEIR